MNWDTMAAGQTGRGELFQEQCYLRSRNKSLRCVKGVKSLFR